MGVASTAMAKQLKSWHQILLAVQVIAIGTLSFKILLNSFQENHAVLPIIYEEKNIEDWQTIDLQSLAAAEINQIISGDFLGGMTQIHTQQPYTLTFQRATLSQSNGDLKKYLKNYSNALSSTLRYHEEIGHYSLFFQGDRLTMMACLTISGRATVTADQFKVAQIKASFKPAQVWSWLINRENLIPHTCQWRSLSLSPATTDSPDTLFNLWKNLNANTIP